MYNLKTLATIATDIEQLINDKGYDGNMTSVDVENVKELMFKQLGDDLGYQLNVGEIEPAQLDVIDYQIGELEAAVQSDIVERISGTGHAWEQDSKDKLSDTLNRLHSRGKLDLNGTELSTGDIAWYKTKKVPKTKCVITSETDKMFRIEFVKDGQTIKTRAAPWSLVRSKWDN